MLTALELENVGVMRGERLVISGFSARIECGRALVLTGSNGSGKTTLIRAIAGLLPTASGDIHLEGGDADVPRSEQCHAVGHLNGLKSVLTVRENLFFWQRFLGGGAGGVERALAQFQLESLADIPVALLSAGQKRRTGLGRLLVASRPIWLLDEPTTSLDTASSALVAQAVNDHLGGGGIAVVATHLMLGLDSMTEIRLPDGPVDQQERSDLGGTVAP